MELIILLLCLFIVALPFASKGWLGEMQSKFNMWIGLNSDVYQRFHNVIVPSANGTTQIDHLLISPFGVFIVETKNLKGWVFGSEKQAKWTQFLYGNNYSFQNPLRQTYRQKRVLSKYLNLDDSTIRTVVYFVGNCTFKTDMPHNVIGGRLASYIKQYQSPILSAQEIERIIEKLNSLRLDSTLTTKNHVKSLRERHNSNTACPRCGSSLVQRTAKQGANAGSSFLGCSNYPRCRFTKNIS
nr:NERD domain-containing protein [Cytophagales bacterium]